MSGNIEMWIDLRSELLLELAYFLFRALLCFYLVHTKLLPRIFHYTIYYIIL